MPYYILMRVKVKLSSGKTGAQKIKKD